MAGGLALSALLCFFLPLVRLRAPLRSERTLRGPDLLRDVVSAVRDLPDAAGPSAADPAAGRLPASVRLSWALPLCILGAAACALASALASLRGSVGARLASAAGALMGLGAIAHSRLLESQVHAMFLGVSEGRRGFHPLARLGDRIGSHLTHGFRIEPGPGLYGIAACLLLAFALGIVMAARRRGSSEQPPPAT